MNEELLDASIDWIEAHPGEWHQGNWRCESGMCLAGVVCQLAGGQWVNPTANGSYEDAWLVAEPEDEINVLRELTGQPVTYAPLRAKRLLGISDDLGLFNGEISTVEDLRQIAAEVKEYYADEPDAA